MKINCPPVDGMVYLEDIMESMSFLDKIRAALTARLPVDTLLPCIRADCQSLVTSRHRHNTRHVREPPRLQDHLRHHPRGTGDYDGGNPDVLLGVSKVRDIVQTR